MCESSASPCVLSVAGRETLCFGDFRRIGNDDDDDDCRNILSVGHRPWCACLVARIFDARPVVNSSGPD